MRGERAGGQEAPARAWRERLRRQRVRWEAGSNLGWHDQKSRREIRYVAGMPEISFPLEIPLLGEMPELPKWENQVKKQEFSPIVFIA